MQIESPSAAVIVPEAFVAQPWRAFKELHDHPSRQMSDEEPSQGLYNIAAALVQEESGEEQSGAVRRAKGLRKAQQNRIRRAAEKRVGRSMDNVVRKAEFVNDSLVTTMWEALPTEVLAATPLSSGRGGIKRKTPAGIARLAFGKPVQTDTRKEMRSTPMSSSARSIGDAANTHHSHVQHCRNAVSQACLGEAPQAEKETPSGPGWE